jgi:LCP family protein required for cell wall assembly
MRGPETDGGTGVLLATDQATGLGRPSTGIHGSSRSDPGPAPTRPALVAGPATAAALSFVFPGLGQAVAGAVRRGAIMAIPTLVVLGGLAAALAAGPAAMLGFVLRPDVLASLLVVNVVLGIYHLVAVVDAWRLPRPAGGAVVGRVAYAVLGGVLGATVLLHGAIGVVGSQAGQTLDSVFPGADGRAIPQASFPPQASGLPAATLGPTQGSGADPAWAADGLLNLLLIGSDAGPDRWSLRTDTMIVLSVDTATARAALFGIPRNIVGVPLPPESAKAFRNGRFPDLLNALYVYAMNHPSQFPGGNARGFRAVTGAIQELLGLQMDALTVINLQGFVSLVNAIGGLWIDIPAPLYDPSYPLETGRGDIVISFKAGCQKLNGRMALAYARSRHQDSDYGRMRRQQAVLTALARQVDPIAMLPRITELLGIARDNLWTTIPREDVAGLAELATRVEPDAISTVTLTPPEYPSNLTTATIKKIRQLASRWVVDQQLAPTPRPTLRPTGRPTPTAKASATTKGSSKASPTPKATRSPAPSQTPKPCSA